MKCFLCNKPADIRLQKNRYACDTCFAHLFEKRIRKFTRINEIFQPKDRILVIGDIAKLMSESIAKNFPLKLFYANKIDNNFVKKNKINKILIEWTLDDEINEHLLYWFENKMPKKQEEKIVKLLCLVTDNEAELFAKIKGIKFTKRKKGSAIQNMLQVMEDKHSNTRYTFYKNMEELNKIKSLKIEK